MIDRVLHPFLLAAFPVLYLWAANMQEGITVGDVLPSLAIILAVTAVVLVAARFLLRNWLKAGVVVSMLIVLFFSYGHVWRAAQGWSIGGLALGRHGYLLPIWAALAAGGIVGAARMGPRLPALTRGLNAVALGLVVLNVASIAMFEIRTTEGQSAVPEVRVPGTEGIPPTGPASPHRPDIYYIVFDRYGGQDALQEVIGFDNAEFLRSLETRGFYVASKSRANYPRTSHSLASSLNMDYLGFLADEVGKASGDSRPLYRLIGRHRVGRTLKSLGYRYVHVGSWWGPTALSPLADVNVPYGGLSEFSSTLLETTAAWPATEVVAQGLGRRREWYGVQRQFEALAQSRSLRGPKFVVAHILSPHEPFVFDRHGRYVSEEEAAGQPRERKYLEQLLFLNRKIEELLDVLLSGPEGSHPVVIIQADEGPFEGPGGWRRAPARMLRRKFGILNAYYLPGAGHSALYPTITPANSFRVVFNEYFGAGLPLLPDRSYVYTDLEHLYEFVDVTAMVGQGRDARRVA